MLTSDAHGVSLCFFKRNLTIILQIAFISCNQDRSVLRQIALQFGHPHVHLGPRFQVRDVIYNQGTFKSLSNPFSYPQLPDSTPCWVHDISPDRQCPRYSMWPFALLRLSLSDWGSSHQWYSLVYHRSCPCKIWGSTRFYRLSLKIC